MEGDDRSRLDEMAAEREREGAEAAVADAEREAEEVTA